MIKKRDVQNLNAVMASDVVDFNHAKTKRSDVGTSGQFATPQVGLPTIYLNCSTYNRDGGGCWIPETSISVQGPTLAIVRFTCLPPVTSIGDAIAMARRSAGHVLQQ